ncbi:hypothetical protein HA402_013427 [Bradysia odoriphaga]|nr:hypothetical protein HA402_013427 [Bradysia odoriphaga]
MFQRNLFVVFKPIKNNTVLLPESYFRTVQNYENGCLCLSYHSGVHHVSWAPYGSSITDTEIGINSTVAKSIGLKEGSLVKCSLVQDVTVLDSLCVTAQSQKDWEMLDVSSYRIQSTLLDQTKIVNSGQNLVVWINRAMSITLRIDRLKPNTSFGRLANNTEVIVAPYKHAIAKSNDIKTLTTQQIIDKIQPINSNMLAEIQHHRDNKLVQRDAKLCKLQRLIESVKSQNNKRFHFRIVSSKWNESQMCDLYLTRHNLPDLLDIDQVHVLQTDNDKEYYVNVKIIGTDETFPHNIYPTIEMNDILMTKLGLKQFDRITLKPKATVLNFIDRIELFPSKTVNFKQVRDIEERFKQYILDNTSLYPLLINQGQIVKLKDDVVVTASIFPDTFKYCLLDSTILKECKIACTDQVKDLSSLLSSETISNGIESGHHWARLEKFEKIVENCVEQIKINLCLDDRNCLWRMGNILISGHQNSGKSTICKEILESLSKNPFYCHSEVFFCSRNKGRKPESIQKDLKLLFTSCMMSAPSILVLDNLDTLTQIAAENSQDGDYYNRVSDVIQHLILEYTQNNPITVIATVTNKNNLNKRIYCSRGRHLFQTIVPIPDLESADREQIITELCQRFKTHKLNYKKFSGLTEGYTIGDLMQFFEKAIFYAYRTDSTLPIITNDILTESIKVTNTYCLQGIENNNKISSADEDSESDRISGLESVVTVLEEVLIWPTKYPTIFEQSPLRNQAGVLLYGPPGTGKTYLVSKLAKLWHLRMICVKGPELLAKFIGQSEENVRNLFDRARSAKPCVLFFDEFDSLAPRRGHDSTGVTDRVVNQLLTELDGVEGLQGVIVIAATSRPELLDGALLRSGRLDRLVECPIPSSSADRLDIFKNLSQSLCFDDTVDLKYFSENTNNYTGADIQSILTSANMAAVKECLERDPENVPDKISISQEHLMDAFINTRPSLSPIDILKYQTVYARFTNKEKPTRDFVAKRATLA